MIKGGVPRCQWVIMNLTEVQAEGLSAVSLV
jgi:hypothetical protein